MLTHQRRSRPSSPPPAVRECNGKSLAAFHFQKVPNQNHNAGDGNEVGVSRRLWLRINHLVGHKVNLAHHY